ncbi:MAG: archaemetzincin [Desulfobacterales bacterium]|nr:archaemetzincin [Desulfobacterales bacterium]
MNIKPENTIVISPIGNFDSEITESVEKGIRRIFSFQATILPLLENAGFAFDSIRNQYHSTPILDKLESCAPSFALKVLAITDVDLFIPVLTHVYGEAQLGGRTCIVSTHRLKGPFLPVSINGSHIQRIVKEAVHELGHTFSLRHCREHSCIMHYCRTELDVDRKSDQLCRYCKILLEDEIKKIKRSGAEEKPC